MAQATMSRGRLEEILGRFPGATVAVLGDLFLDKHLVIDRRLDEPSLETGLTAYQVTAKRISPGAAGNVLCNLSALGVGRLYAISAVGEDGEGFELLRCLEKRRVDTSFVLQRADIFTPTYIKPIHAQNGVETEGNRIDVVNETGLPACVESHTLRALLDVAQTACGVLTLDQVSRPGTGVVTQAVRDALAQTAHSHPDKVFFADSRTSVTAFRNALIKCNDKEASRAVYGAEKEDMDEAQLTDCEARLRGITGADVVITCGAKGAWTDGALMPAVRLDCPVDICGCGDAFSAAMVSALCVGATRREAAFLGNLAASVTACKIGVTGTATPEELLGRYDSLL